MSKDQSQTPEAGLEVNRLALHLKCEEAEHDALKDRCQKRAYSPLNCVSQCRR